MARRLSCASDFVNHSVRRRTPCLIYSNNSSRNTSRFWTKIQQEGAQLLNLNLDGNQLFLKATAVSEASKNRIWDAIKAVDPNFADLKHDIEVHAGAQSYTVQPGDNLSKISKHFYGDANKYPVIAKANNLEDPDKIKVGQKLVIPAAA